MSAAATAEPLVVREDRAGVATVTLNRPQQRNALSRALMTALQDTLATVATDSSVRAVVLAARGPAFCSGHDLKELRAHPTRDFYDATFRQCAALMLALTRLPQPVIARVHGIATAAGCQLVASCDLALAADGVQFATPGVNIGLFCSTPMVALTRAIGRKAAMEMLLIGEMVDAATAVRIGLINRAVPAADLDGAVQGWAERIAAKSPLTVTIGKEAFYRQVELELPVAYDYCAEVMTRNMLARDAAEGIDAFLAKRTPVWQGC